MNDDLEPRLHDALHSGSLPPAPDSLIEALQRVADAPVRLRRRGATPILGIFAAAAILVVASAVALSGGSVPRPAPSSQTPPPSAAGGVPGLHLAYTAQPVDGRAPTPADMAKVASVLRARVDAMGVADSTVTTHDRVVVVELPGVVDPADVETVGRILGHTGKIDFVPLGDTQVGVGEPIDLTRNPPLFGGDQIASATVAADQNGSPAVDFVLKPDGTRLFADYTANHIGSYFAITMDGDVLSAPVIQNAIPNGDIEITGGGLTGFDATHAHGLVALIGSGELPVPLVLTSSAVVGPSSAAPSATGPTASPPPALSAPGLHLEYTAQAVDGVAPTPADILAIASIVRSRVDALGVVDPSVATRDGVVLVDLPGVIDPPDVQAIGSLLSRIGRVSFVSLGEHFATEGRPLDFEPDPPIVAGGQIKSARTGSDALGNSVVDLVLDTGAAQSFADYTSRNLGNAFALTLDGVVVSVPIIQAVVTDGNVEITGAGRDFSSVIDAESLVAIVRSGPLPFQVDLTALTVTESGSPSPEIDKVLPEPTRLHLVPEPGSCPPSARCKALAPGAITR